MANAINIIINGIDNASGALGRVSDSLTNMGSKLTSVGGSLTAATLPLAILGTVGIKTAADFETSMNILVVAARSSGESMEDLSAAALAVGGDVTLVGVSASEAGDSMTEMYKAGLTTNQIFGDMQGYLQGTTGLTGALRAAIDLAAASELDLGAATTVVGVAMNQFGLDASEASNIANILVQTADAGVASVSGLSDALVNVGPVAAGMGQSLGDTTLALGLMAQAGITGSEAGTGLKSMLLNLSRTTPDVTGTLNALNVSLYDASGAMLPLPNILGQLEASMAGMTEEQRNATLATLAGSYGQVAMRTLLAEGSVGWNEMAVAIGNAATVEESATARTQGFNAAMETLKGVIETLMITALTPLIEKLTPLIAKFSEIAAKVIETDPALMGLAVTIGLLAVAAGPVLMVLGVMVTALGALLSPIGLVVLAVIGLMTAWITNFGGIRDATMPIVEGIVGLFGQIVGWLQENLPLAVARLKEDWALQFGNIWLTVQQVFNDIRIIIDQVISIITRIIEEHGPRVVGIMESTYNRILAIVLDVTGAISVIVETVFGYIKSFLAIHGTEITGFIGSAWERIALIVDNVVKIIELTIVPVFFRIAIFLREHGEEIQTVLSAAWTIIKNIIELALNLIQGIVRTVLAILRGDWEGAWTAIKDMAESIWSNIKAIIEGWLTIIQTTVITPLMNAIQSFLETTWNAIKTTAETIWAAIKSFFETTWNNIKTTAETIWNAVKTFFETTFNTIKTTAETIWAAIKLFFETTWKAIKTTAETIWNAIKTFFETTWNNIKEGIEAVLFVIKTLILLAWTAIDEMTGGALTTLLENITRGWNFIQTTTETIWNAIKLFFETTWNAIKTTAEEIYNAIKAFLETTFTSIQTTAEEIWNAIKSFLETTFNTIKTFFENIWNAIKSFFETNLAETKTTTENQWNAIKTFLETTFNTIKTTIETIWTAVKTFFETTFNTIKTFIETIWTAIKTFFETTFNAIKTLAETIWNAIKEYVYGENMTLKELINTIWTAIKTFFETTFNAIKTAAETILGGMRDSLQNLWANMRDQATSLVGSLRDDVLGILSGIAGGAAAAGAGMVRAFADGVIGALQSAIDAARRLAQRLRDLLPGSDAATGPLSDLGAAGRAFATRLAEGIDSGIGVVGLVGMDVANTLRQALGRITLEAAEEGTQIAGALSSMLDAVVAMIDAVNVLATATLPEASIGGTIDRLIVLLNDIITRLIEAADNFSDKGLAAAVAFAEAAGTIGQGISDAFEGLMLALTFRLPQVADGTDELFEALRRFVAKLQTMAANMGYQAFEEALRFADAAGRIGQGISDAFEGLMLALTFRLPEVEDGTDQLFEALRRFVAKLQTMASSMAYQGFEQALVFAEAAGAIGQNISDAFEGLMLALTFRLPQVADGTDELFEALRRFVAKLQTMAASMAYQGFEQALVFAEAAGAIGSAIGDAVEGLNVLLTYSGGLATEAINRFYGDMMTLIEIIGQWQDNINQDWLDAAVAFAEAAGAVGGAMQSAVEGLNALLTYVGGLTSTIINRFYGDIMTLIETIGQWQDNINQDWLDAAVAFAEGAGAVGGAMGDAVEGLNVLLGYVGGLAETTILRFYGDMMTLIEVIGGYTDNINAEWLAQATEFAEAAGNVGKAIGDAIEGLNALLGYTGGLAEATILQFYGDMMTLIEVIGLWTDNINEGWLAAAVSFATAAGNVGKGIKDAIEGLKALMTYTGGLAEETILQFYGDMMTLIEVIGLWTDNISEDWLAAAVVFATAAGNVGKAIGDAIEGLTAIKDYSGLAQDTFDQFLEDIRQVMNKMVAASQAGGIGIDAALEFAENIAQIVQQIIGAMTSLRTVAGYEGGQTAATMEAFLADVGLIIADLQSSAGLMENGEIVAQTIATTGAQIGQALLDGMTAAASAPTGITSAFEAIVAAVMATFVALQVQFASMKNAAWAFGRDWVLMLINGMESRLDDLVALLAYIRGLFPSSPAKYGPFKTLPDGETVGAGFASSMADGLWSGAGGLVDALSGLSGAFGMRGGGFGGLEPVMAGGGGGGPITININNPTVRNDRDIELMAAEISDILARQAATNSRLGRL